MNKSGFFNRPLTGDQKIIMNVLPADFDALKKLIGIEQKIVGKPSFSVQDSKYARSFDYGKSNMSMDLTCILGNHVHFSMVGNMNLLKRIKGNGHVLIIREGSEYIITNGLYEIKLGHSELFDDHHKLDSEDFEQIGTDLVLNDEIGSLKTFISSSKYADLLIHKGQADQIRLPNQKLYSFDSGVIGENRHMKPESSLRLYRFLAVPGKKCVIRVFGKNGLYRVITVTSVGKDMEIHLCETVESLYI